MLNQWGLSWSIGLELRPGEQAGTEMCAESWSCATSENSKSPASLGIRLESPIGQESELHLVAVALNCLESAGVDHVAESQGGQGDSSHEEGLPQCVV